MQGDEELTSVLVEQKDLDESLEDDEPVRGGITLVVHDLVLLELAEGHVTSELPAIHLGKDLDRKHVGERAGHLAELFRLHGGESLGEP